MSDALIVSKVEGSTASFDVLDPVEIEVAQGERAIAVNVIATNEERMRKRALVSTHGVPGYGTFEVHCDEGTPLGGDDSAPPPLGYLAVGVAFCALTHVTEYARATKMAVDGARIELQLGFATSVTPRSLRDRTGTGRCTGVTICLRIDTEEAPERVAELAGIVRQACMALQSLVQPVPADFSVQHNGKPLEASAERMVSGQ